MFREMVCMLFVIVAAHIHNLFVIGRVTVVLILNRICKDLQEFVEFRSESVFRAYADQIPCVVPVVLNRFCQMFEMFRSTKNYGSSGIRTFFS